MAPGPATSTGSGSRPGHVPPRPRGHGPESNLRVASDRRRRGAGLRRPSTSTVRHGPRRSRAVSLAGAGRATDGARRCCKAGVDRVLDTIDGGPGCVDAAGSDEQADGVRPCRRARGSNDRPRRTSPARAPRRPGQPHGRPGRGRGRPSTRPSSISGRATPRRYAQAPSRAKSEGDVRSTSAGSIPAASPPSAPSASRIRLVAARAAPQRSGGGTAASPPGRPRGPSPTAAGSGGSRGPP